MQDIFIQMGWNSLSVKEVHNISIYLVNFIMELVRLIFTFFFFSTLDIKNN